MPLRLDAAAVSDVGLHRPGNQDASFTASWGAGVADGVGGGPAGDLASATLIRRLTAGPWTVEDAEDLTSRVRGANWDLRAHIERDPALHGMATTFTALIATTTGSFLLAHSGDSRAYRLRAGRLLRRTRDDSLVQALVDQGVVAAEDAASHPHRNIVTASLGGGEDDRLFVAEELTLPGDRWLLCSDGVSDYVPEEELTRVLDTGRSPRETANAVVSLALEAGTRDNVTAVVGDVRQGPPDFREHALYNGAAATWYAQDLEDTA